MYLPFLLSPIDSDQNQHCQLYGTFVVLGFIYSCLMFIHTDAPSVGDVLHEQYPSINRASHHFHPVYLQSYKPTSFFSLGQFLKPKAKVSANCVSVKLNLCSIGRRTFLVPHRHQR